MIPAFKNTWAVLDQKERSQFTVLVILDLLISVADIASLAILLWIIQFYIQPAGNADLSFLPAWLTDRNSVWLIALFFLLFGIKNGIAWLISNKWYQFISRVAVRISKINLQRYQHAGFEEYINTDSSVHIRKISVQPFEFCQHVLAGIPQIITQFSLILLTVIAILLFNAKLFLLLLVILLPPVIAIFYFIRNRLAKAKNEIRTSHETSFQYLLDALKGYVEGNIYNRNDFFLRRFIRARKQFSHSLFSSINIQMMPPRVIEVFAVLGLFILIIVAKWAGNSNTDDFITLGAFIGAAYKIIPGVVKIINLGGQVRAYGSAATELLQSKPAGKVKKENSSYAGLNSLELNNISFQYSNERLITNFSFAVQKGDFLVITGESGKGKTTILNILLGFLSSSNGSVLINDRMVDCETIKDFWPSIAYVKQQSFLIHDSVLRNITLEENNHDATKLQQAVEISGLDKLITAWPEGVNKMITENGKNISGGQRQRIAIARALYKNADLIVLDEPFNELDDESECALLKSFKQLSQSGKMVLLVTHNRKSLSFANKTISLDDKN